MARRVEDLSPLLSVIEGFNAPESASAPTARMTETRRLNLRGLSLAWYADDGVSPVTESTRATVRAAARALEEAGLDVTERLPPGVGRGHELWLALFSRAIHGPLLATYAGREEEAGAFVRFLIRSLAAEPAPSLDEFTSAWAERDRLRAALVEWMTSTPLIVAPVGATHAFEHGARRVEVSGQTLSVFRAFSYSQTFNVFGLPVVCVPAGRSPEGLPIGVQIIGRPFEEEAVLAAASVVEEALGGWQPPPLLLLALSPEGHNPL